jgi:hypothetical protein
MLFVLDPRDTVVQYCEERRRDLIYSLEKEETLRIRFRVEGGAGVRGLNDLREVESRYG